MKRNSRFALALHTLGHMAAEPDRIRTSAEMADHAGTNPVVVRRVLGKLRTAGLLTSEKGHAGGWRLARDPGEITLADVYRALGESFFAADDNAEPPTCSVEIALNSRVKQVLQGIERDLITRFSATTIAEVEHAEGCDCSACIPN